MRFSAGDRDGRGYEFAGIGYPYLEQAGRAFADSVRGRRPTFVCVVGHTDTCLIPGISAAGATAELRPYTPAADVEALYHGRPLCLPRVPSNPLGPPGPSIITMAALELVRMDLVVVDAGTSIKPQTPLIRLGSRPGRSILTGRAVPNARELFQRGRALGKKLGAGQGYLVVGESVPGGTTTALAVLTALGYQADGKVSSSLSENAHGLKSSVVSRALEVAGLSSEFRVSSSAHGPSRKSRDSGLGTRDCLEVLAAVGDPMQPAAAGLAIGALERGCPVLLAGGTQMVAVLAVMDRLLRGEGRSLSTDQIAVATTRWVVDDPTADFVGLLRQVGQVPGLCTRLSFGGSRHASLQRYEEFLVKEGVGAGGAAVAASLSAGVDLPGLLDRIERIYERLT